MYTDEEIMKVPTQMRVYIRKWRPSEYSFDPMKEVILDSASPDDLKKKVYIIHMRILNNNKYPENVLIIS